MLENNSYLFVSKGEPFDGRACLGAFHKIRLIGEGGYGKVYLAFNKMTKEEVAMKFIKLKELKANMVSKIYKEAEALEKLRHTNIINLKMTFPL
jgi:serine/threonine protein kinase